MKKKLYQARWAQFGQPSTASVDLYASTDENAKRQADKLARSLGVIHTPRTIYEGGRCVEILDRGKR